MARAATGSKAARKDSAIASPIAESAKIAAVMKAAETSGLMSERGSRIGGRVSAALIAQAKKRTGIEGDTDLIAFALANVALADDFPKIFKASRGAVSAALKLGF